MGLSSVVWTVAGILLGLSWNDIVMGTCVVKKIKNRNIQRLFLE